MWNWLKKATVQKISIGLIVVMVTSLLTSYTELSQVRAEGRIVLGEEEVQALYQSRESKRVSVHDPSIVKGENDYSIFGSHMASASSKDLFDWNMFSTESLEDSLFDLPYTEAFRPNDSTEVDAASWIETTNAVQGNMWAPDVIYNTKMQKWCMYLSLNGELWNSLIVLMTADSKDGPYTYRGPVVYSGFRSQTGESVVNPYTKTDINQVLQLAEGEDLPERYQGKVNTNFGNSEWRYLWPNAIDPCVFYDEEGTLWMSYGSWFGGIYMIQLDGATGLRDYTKTYDTVQDTEGDLAYQGYLSDAYFGIRIAGGEGASGEASYIEKIGDYYYLFMSYGGLEAKGGYSMRVFRAENPTGPYNDVSGDSAIYHQQVGNTNINGTIGTKIMTYYKWSFMDWAQVAQGHNSAFVDEDGKAYVVYHTRTNDGTEGHSVRVHQLFLNEDGWMVAAPMEYAGESISKTGYEAQEVVGSYEVINHKAKIDYGNLEYAGGQELILQSDGSIVGDYTGKWTMQENSPYVTLIMSGKEYKGVFVEQYMEETNVKTMTFSVVGEDDLCIWGAKIPSDDVVVAWNAAENLGAPKDVFSDIELPKTGVFGAEYTWVSSNPNLLSNEGKIAKLTKDEKVTLTLTIAKGNYEYSKVYDVTVKADMASITEPYLLASYFTGEKVDLSTAVKGSYVVDNPFYKNVSYGLDISGGVSIAFDVERTGEKGFLTNILALNSESGGKLYFTGDSYLGYNATGGYFDANLHTGDDPVEELRWTPGEDYIGANRTVHVEIKLTATGYSVSFNGEEMYNETTVKQGVTPGYNSMYSYKNVLSWLTESASTLNFGWGSWWEGGFQGTISDVNCYVYPSNKEEAVLQATPIYYYDFTEQNNGQVINKGSKEGAGVLHGTASIGNDPDRGNVLKLNSTEAVTKENYFALPSDTFDGMSEGYTVGMWVNVDKNDSNYWEHSALFEANGGGQNRFPMTRLGANLWGRINSNGAWADATTVTTGITNSTWQYITYTVNKEGLAVYLDGKLVGADGADLSKCFADNALKNMTDVRIGSGNIFGDKDLSAASFDNVAVFDKALTEGEVSALYTQEKIGNPIYYYDFSNMGSEMISSGVKSTQAEQYGTANTMLDEERGSVLSVQSSTITVKENYLALPTDTFDGIEDGYTIGMWVNVDKTDANYWDHSALFEANGGGKDRYPMTRIGANLWGRINCNGAWADVTESSKGLQSGTWQYVAYTVNKQGIAVYVDGELVGSLAADLSRSFADNALALMTDVRIGSGNIFGDRDLANAKFDNVAVYGQGYSEQEIRILYNAELHKAKIAVETDTVPTPSPEATVTPSPEATATPSPEATAMPSPEATATPSPEATATPSPEPTATPSPEANIKVTKVALNKTKITLPKGKTTTLRAFVFPTNATNQVVTWQSSNPKIATVDRTGKIRAHSSGRVTIKVSATDGSGKYATCTVTVPYNIKYQLNGGKNSKSNPSTYYRTKVSLKAPTRAGYSFSGWYTSSKYKTRITTISSKANKDYTLHAKWTKVKVGKTKRITLAKNSSKSIKVKIQKVSGAAGYQVVYATNRSFTKSKKVLVTTKLQNTITKLKRGQRYYVKVRAFKVDSTGKRVYGQYSAVQSIVINRK